jgi:hypothetical protein
VDIKTEFVDSKTNHQRVIFKFTPYVFSGLEDIQIKGANLMPQKAIESIVKSCLPDHPYRVDIGVMDKVREKIEKWLVFIVSCQTVSYHNNIILPIHIIVIQRHQLTFYGPPFDTTQVSG